MDRYICIHGHFYQPPRENPWLEHVEGQESAYPYHDWNERITAECYAPNSRSRILDGEGRIAELVNNYSWMSFNFGPTLLSWLEHHSPEVYESILQADRDSREHFGGHGSALAQAFNHTILPLGNERDIETQVAWGVYDFKRRFGRAPEGMWLPEAAVSMPVLEALVRHGIRFTILAPRQAHAVRPLTSDGVAGEWTNVSEARIDPTMPYVCRLPSGKSIVLFFYDGPISQALAFEDLLNSGEAFAQRLESAFRDDRQHAQLVHIATDGETYGHHRRHADMALAYAMRHVQENTGAQLINYAQFLEKHPPQCEVAIYGNSSWSCIHGVERWRSHCGCNSGGYPGWRQDWRGPLRAALDWLRDECAELFEHAGASLFRDPWKARDAYIQVIHNRDPGTLSRYLATHGKPRLSAAQRVRALQMLEMQRHAMLMYTSCGWFFDELSGIETVQVIAYAARALQLAEQAGAVHLEDEFLNRLERVRSNIPEHATGRVIYEKWVRPAKVDLAKVAAHYAVSSLFEPYADTTRIYSHQVTREDHDMQIGGKRRLAVGRIKVESAITREAAVFSFGVLHFGDHNISGGVRPFQGASAYQKMKAELAELFRGDHIPEMIRATDRLFGGGTYTLRYLFRDEQQKIVRLLLETAIEHATSLYRGFYNEYGPLARFLSGLSIPLPSGIRVAIDFTLHQELVAVLSTDEPDIAAVRSLVDQIRAAGLQLDSVRLEFALRRVIEREARAWRSSPGDMESVRRLHHALDVLALLPFEIDLWTAQNMAYDVLRMPAQKQDGTWRHESARLAVRLGVAGG